MDKDIHGDKERRQRRGRRRSDTERGFRRDVYFYGRRPVFRTVRGVSEGCAGLADGELSGRAGRDLSAHGRV